MKTYKGTVSSRDRDLYGEEFVGYDISIEKGTPSKKEVEDKAWDVVTLHGGTIPSNIRHTYEIEGAHIEVYRLAQLIDASYKVVARVPSLKAFENVFKEVVSRSREDCKHEKTGYLDRSQNRIQYFLIPKNPIFGKEIICLEDLMEKRFKELLSLEKGEFKLSNEKGRMEIEHEIYGKSHSWRVWIWTPDFESCMTLLQEMSEKTLIKS